MNNIVIDTSDVLNPIKYQPYSLVDESNPILKRVMPEFDFNSGVDSGEISNRMKETLKLHKAFGLAAPQCGLEYNVCVIGAEDNYLTLFNPKILYKSVESVHMEEGCLSYPFMILSITRPSVVDVQYQDERGTFTTQTFSGITARIVQHEIDHLNGVTFITLAKPLALKHGYKKRDKHMKRFAKALVAQRRLSETVS